MKTVNITYFRDNGNWFTNANMGVEEGIEYDELIESITKLRPYNNSKLYMLIQDSNDGKQPYITPHLFSPTSYWE